MADNTITKQYLDLTGLSQYDALIKQEIVDAVKGKADSTHNHDDAYYKKTEVDTTIANLTNGTTKVKAAENADKAGEAAKLGAADVGSATQPVYLEAGVAKAVTAIDIAHGGTGATTAEVARTNLGVYSKGEVDDKVKGFVSATDIATHNAAVDAHADIRKLISDLSGQVDTFLDVDDTTKDQLSEVIALIEGNSGALVDTVKKVDIVDSLTSTETTKVLSAKQGKELKALIDGVDSALDGKADEVHSHDVATESAIGFMSTAMVTKLAGIAEGANKTIVDTALNKDSANPIENKAVYVAIDTATQAIGANTQSISSHTTAITNLQNAVNGIEAIPTTSIQALFATT